jgi:hypothetical protein
LTYPVTFGGETFVESDFTGYAYTNNWERFLTAYAQAGQDVEDLIAASTVSFEGIREASEDARDASAGSAAAAAASLAAAQLLTGGSQGIGPGALSLPRGIDLGDAAYWDSMSLAGRFILQQNTSYQMVPQDFRKLLLGLSGAPTYTLPLASDVPIGWWVEVKARGTTITVARAGADTVDGTTSLSITTGTARRIVRSGATSFESI